MKNTFGFEIMKNVLPESQVGDYFIKHTIIDEEIVKFGRLRSIFSGKPYWMNSYTEVGTYAMLTHNGTIWMSDTGMERFTNRQILQKAFGDVLILGLGIGMLPLAVSKKDEVTSVTVVEISPEVIQLVHPHIANDKLKVINGDAYSPAFAKKSFDTIYLDIWPDICGDNWEEIKVLMRKYRPLLRQNGIIDAWLKDHVKYLAKNDRW